MNQHKRIHTWLMKDKIAERSSKVIVEHIFDLTYEKLLRAIKNKFVKGHDDFTNFYCIHKKDLKEF